MKKILTILVLLITLCGCNTSNNNTALTIEPTTYFQTGRYYFNADLQGQVLTDDGNLWEYTQDIISDEVSYHNEPIIACIYDNGTPNVIEDDIILGLVLDQEAVIQPKFNNTQPQFNDDVRMQSIRIMK